MDTLTIETDRSAIDRRFGLSVGLLALVVLIDLGGLGFVLVKHAGAIAVITFVFVPLILVPMGILQITIWRAARRVETPLVLNRAGLVFSTLHGQVGLPWEAVSQVIVDGQLWVRPHPQAAPGSPGVYSTVPASRWQAIFAKDLRVSVRDVQIGPNDLRAAIADLSAGRCVPNAP